MGAEFQSYTSRHISADALETEFDGVTDKARYDYGHAGYSGTFAEKTALRIVNDLTFPSVESAEKWLMDNCDKWGDALAIPVVDAETQQPLYVIGAWCSS